MKSGWQWPWIIVALLLLCLVFQGILLYVATADPSFAIEEDYYQKALDWDDRMTQAEENRRLGWRLQVVDQQPTADGTVLMLEVRDADGRPLPGLSGTVAAFPLARARERIEQDLKDGPAPGLYWLAVPPRKGWWELTVELRHAGGDRFRQVLRKELE